MQLDPEFLQEGKEKAQAIATDPIRGAALFKKAYGASPDVKKGKEDTGLNILTIISTNPGITVREINRILGEQFRYRITQGGLRGILKALEEQDAITTDKGKRPSRYFVKES